MCIIIDVNLRNEFFDENNHDMKPIHNWINKNGKIVLGGEYTKEFCSILIRKNREIIDSYRERGKLKIIKDVNIEEEEKRLSKAILKSNDRHIIKLAFAANVKVLVSKDKPLHQDFKNIVRGSVYQNKDHKRLLTPDTCP